MNRFAKFNLICDGVKNIESSEPDQVSLDQSVSFRPIHNGVAKKSRIVVVPLRGKKGKLLSHGMTLAKRYIDDDNTFVVYDPPNCHEQGRELGLFSGALSLEALSVFEDIAIKGKTTLDRVEAVFVVMYPNDNSEYVSKWKQLQIRILLQQGWL